uniref:Secreted protein n=1 Tax=Anopheles darlingi TaxID=43151 RepID=A0A2M4D868_ANODA
MRVKLKLFLGLLVTVVTLAASACTCCCFAGDQISEGKPFFDTIEGTIFLLDCSAEAAIIIYSLGDDVR